MTWGGKCSDSMEYGESREEGGLSVETRGNEGTEVGKKPSQHKRKIRQILV